MSDTGGAFKKFRLHSITVHTSLVPQPSLVPESVNIWRTVQLSPTVHKGLCYLVSVFPSFTYLTAAVLSFVVFPFYFVFHQLRPPAEQWIILIVSLSDPSDQHVCVDFDRFDCDIRLFHYDWRYHARQGQTNYSMFHWNLNIFNGLSG